MESYYNLGIVKMTTGESGEGLSNHLLEFNSRDSASEFITCSSYLLEKAKLFLH